MIYPAIDLMDGGCVRLLKGDFHQRTNYVATPKDVVKSYRDAGAQWIHIVDLDGARDAQAQQSDLIMDLAQHSGVNVQTGGGLRSLDQVETLLNGGVARVVIGSLALKEPDIVKHWLDSLGPEKIVLALDVRVDADGVPYPTTHGWTETSGESLWQVLDDYGSRLSTILVTDIERDGVLGGANLDLYRDIQTRFPNLDLITSGGVGTLDDVKALKALDPEGIIIGKALYENRFTLAEAIQC